MEGYDLPKDAFRALTYLPGADNPDEWMTADALGQLLTDLHGEHVGDRAPSLLRTLRTNSLVISRGGAFRRTPTGTAVLNRRGRGES